MPYPGFSGWIVQLDPPAVATDRVMLDINNPDVSGISIGAEGTDGTVLDWGTMALTQFLAQNGQWGSAPADFLAPNRTVTIPIGLGMSSHPDAPDPETALRNLSMKVARLAVEGGQMLREREGGQPLYLDVVDAQLDVPDSWMETAGVEPGVTLTLTCLPDFYGAEIQLDTMYCTGFCTGVLSSGGVPAVIQGDYPARCRLEVMGFSEEQPSVMWGIRSRYYDAASTAQILYAATSIGLSPGSATTLAGSSFPKAWEGSTDYDWTALYLNGLTHIGSYRMLVRAYTTATPTDVGLQLTWEVLGGPSEGIVNPAVMMPAANEWCLVDLGLVNLQSGPIPAYPSNWTASIQVERAGTATVAFDYLMLMPVSEHAGVVGNANAVVSGAGGGAWLTDAGNYDVYGDTASIVASIGDLARIPPSGLEERPVQLLVKPSRGAQPGAADAVVDTFTVTPYYRPTYLSRI